MRMYVTMQVFAGMCRHLQHTHPHILVHTFEGMYMHIKQCMMPLLCFRQNMQYQHIGTYLHTHQIHAHTCTYMQYVFICVNTGTYIQTQHARMLCSKSGPWLGAGPGGPNKLDGHMPWKALREDHLMLGPEEGVLGLWWW